ncbi:lipopolysaccharide biosynthesis protein, partial [Enterobacter hormaechei]
RTPLINDFKEGFDAFLGEFSPNLYSNIPPLIIGAIVSPVIFACYSIALRIINISGSFQSIAAKSLYPLVVKGTSTMRVLLLINLILSAIPFLAIMFFGNEIIHLLLGSGYELAHTYLIICAPALILYSIICSFSYGFFLPKRLDSYFKKTSLFSSIIPAIIGYPLMHQYQVYGALIMLLIARGLFVIMFVYYYLKVKNN